MTMNDANGLFSHVNDSIRGLATDGPSHEVWQFICECPDLDCHELVWMTLVDFDARRSASVPSPILSSTHAN